MENLSSNSGGHNSLGGLQTAPEVQFDLKFETSNLDYPGINGDIAIFVVSEAVAASKWPRRSHLTSELNLVTSITYVAMLLWLLAASSDLILPGEEEEEEGQT